MHKDELNIILPVKNRASTLVRAMDSVKAQTYRPIRLIIVDNDSTDDSYSIASSWALRNHKDDFRVIILKETRPGASSARNSGLKKVEGKYVAFLDSDDEYHPDFASTLMREACSHPETDIFLWKVRYHFLSDKTHILKYHGWNWIHSQIFHTVIRTMGCAVSADFICKSGGWNEYLPVWNDWELGLRMLFNDPKIHIIHKVFSEVYAQRQSITGESFSLKAGQWEKSIDTAEQLIKNSGHMYKDRILRMLMLRKIILAATYAREGNQQIAKTLLNETLNTTGLSNCTKYLLKSAFLYTRLIGSGTARVFSPLLYLVR